MNLIEEHINYYQNFAPNPTAFRESLENALVYAKNANKNLNMDLRDYFAAKAMAHQRWEAGYDDRFFDARAKSCYKMADAMMKAREQ